MDGSELSVVEGSSMKMAMPNGGYVLVLSALTVSKWKYNDNCIGLLFFINAIRYIIWDKCHGTVSIVIN